MSALAAGHDSPAVDTLLPGPRRDAGIVRAALLGAIALHALALLLPLPERALPQAGLSDPPDDPIIRRPTLPPPPPPPEPERTEIVVGPRRVPATMPMPSLEPSLEQETIVDDLPPGPPPSVVAFTGEIARPPEPAIYDQGTIGLVLPVALGDRASPAYPAIARMAGREGRVVLLATISERGSVEAIEVLAAPTPELGFVDAAIEAVSSWRYEPGTLHGRAVAVQMTVVVTFDLR